MKKNDDVIDIINFSKEIYLSLMNELSLWLLTSKILEQSIGVRVKEMIVEKKIAPIIVTASSSNNFAVSPFKKTTGMKILIKTTDVDIIAKSGFQDMGMDSMMGLQFRNQLSIEFGIKLPSILIYQFSNIGELQDHVIDLFGRKKSEIREVDDMSKQEIIQNLIEELD